MQLSGVGNGWLFASHEIEPIPLPFEVSKPLLALQNEIAFHQLCSLLFLAMVLLDVSLLQIEEINLLYTSGLGAVNQFQKKLGRHCQSGLYHYQYSKKVKNTGHFFSIGIDKIVSDISNIFNTVIILCMSPYYLNSFFV